MESDLFRIFNVDCLGKGGLEIIADESVDLILCDPPFGVTARNKWDIPLDLSKLFSEIDRIIKERGAVILFAQGMFTARIMTAWERYWRYNLVWKKNKPRGFLNAKLMPLRYHEDLVVFYKKLPPYHPQMIKGYNPIHDCKRKETSVNYGVAKGGKNKRAGKTDRYPGSILEFPVVNYPQHPTQKPVELCEFLIKSYSSENDIILDMCMGSGTTGVAAIKLKRQFIGFETEKEYYDIALERLTHVLGI